MRGSKKVPSVAIVGKKKVGKTSLIERLIPLLKKKGYSVGVLKYDVREFQMDYPGKDTYRSCQAGADSVLISTPEKLALIKGLNSKPTLQKLITKYFADVDIVLIEGYKEQDCPKIYLIEPSEARRSRPNANDTILVIEKKAVEEVSPRAVQKAFNFIVKKCLKTI